MNPITIYMSKLEGSHIMLLQIDTLHCQQKELAHKGGQTYSQSMVHVLHVQWLAKRHVLG